MSGKRTVCGASWRLIRAPRGRYWAAAAAVLLVSGWGHRVLLARIDAALGTVLRPKQEFSSLPVELGAWRGRDVPLNPGVLRVGHFDDDYINRVYMNEQGAVVGAFVGYVGRPRAHLGHRPDRCYAAHGWTETGRELIHQPGTPGAGWPCILYEFQRPADFGPPLLVLATYFINGRYLSDPAEIGAWNSRSVGLFGERPAYLARLQVSKHASGDRSADLEILQNFTSAMTEAVVEIMPYWDQEG